MSAAAPSFKSAGHPLAHAIGAAWDGWQEIFLLRERRALCELAFVDVSYASMLWHDIPADVRQTLITGVRAAIDFGAACARIVITVQRAAT